MSELTIDTLLQERRIERVLNRYATALDGRDWSALDDVFASDATAYYEGIGSYNGRSAIVKLIKTVLSGCGPTQHLLGNVRIEVDGHEARARCYLQAIHVGVSMYAGSKMTVWGEYRDTLRLTTEGWRITHRELAGIHAEGDVGIAVISRE